MKVFTTVFFGCFFLKKIEGETNHNVNQQEITILMVWDVLVFEVHRSILLKYFICLSMQILKTVLYFMRLLPYLYTKKNGMRMMHNDKAMPF